MNRFQLLLAFLTALTATFIVAPAQAQTPQQTWVSASGTDGDGCTRSAPCRTFAGALAETFDGGRISCVDPANFGPITIAKSITIDCSTAQGAILAAPLENAIVINGAGIKVVLRGLSIDSRDSPMSRGLNAIHFLQGASLVVEDSSIENFNSVQPNGSNGILIAPSAGVAEIFISNSQIRDTGTPGLGAGVMIRPTGSARVNIVVVNSSVDDNDIGIRALPSGGAKVNLAISNSSTSGNARIGIAAAGKSDVHVQRATVVGNGMGLYSVAPAITRLGDSLIANNVTGISGTVSSYGNNQMGGNTVQDTSTPGGPVSRP